MSPNSHLRLMDKRQIIKQYQKKLLRKYEANHTDFDKWLDMLVKGFRTGGSVSETTFTENMRSDVGSDKSSDVDGAHCGSKVFKYEEVIRGEGRKKLHGESCECCRKYFDEYSGRADKASRHRKAFSRPPTPENFWKMDF